MRWDLIYSVRIIYESSIFHVQKYVFYKVIPDVLFFLTSVENCCKMKIPSRLYMLLFCHLAHLHGFWFDCQQSVKCLDCEFDMLAFLLLPLCLKKIKNRNSHKRFTTLWQELCVSKPAEKTTQLCFQKPELEGQWRWHSFFSYPFLSADVCL